MERRIDMSNWEEVGGHTKFVKYKECVAGQTLVEGKYVGKAQNQYGEYFKFRGNEGGHIGLRGGHLAYLMKDIAEGQPVKVVFEGTFVLKDGPYRGKESHRVKVFTKGKADDGLDEDFFDEEDVDLDAFGDEDL
jgi:hypothetical protein